MEIVLETTVSSVPRGTEETVVSNTIP
jgi:hypothetical protein